MRQPLGHVVFRVLGSAVLLANGCGFLVGVAALAQPRPPAATDAVGIQTLKEEAARLQIQFEYWEKRATQMQWLVGLILAINSLYAIALAAGSYLNLRPLLESARRELDELRRFAEKAPRDTEDRVKEADRKVAALIGQARADLVDFRTEIRSDLPTLQNMDKALRNILADIRRHLPTDQDWAQSAYYGTLSLAEREQIRYAELTVAGFKFFELGRVASFRCVVSEIYRGLGQYYGSYYLASRKAPGGADNSLFERASLYFEEASAVHSDSAAAFKDIGVLQTRSTDEARWPRLARAAFERSLQLEAGEPGAHFGLGWLEYKDQNWAKAIGRYSALVEKKDWREADRAKYLPDSYLNRACCIARRAAGVMGGEDVTAVVADCRSALEAARSSGVDVAFRPRLARELASEGDLAALARQSPEQVRDLLA